MVKKTHTYHFHSRLNTKLIRVGRKSHLDARSLFEGVFLSGGTGSGKSSGPIKLIAETYFASNWGGIIVTSKPEETPHWIATAQRFGRLDDLVVMDDSLETRFNMLDFSSATMGANGFDQNTVTLIMQLSEAMAVSRGEASSGENSFFKDAAIKWLSHTLLLLRIAYGRLRMIDIYEMIISAPNSDADLSNPKWQNESFCAQTLYKVVEKEKEGDVEASRIVSEHTDFWLKELPKLTGKTRASLVATLTNSLSPMLSGAFHQLFCTHTNWVPHMARQSGKILIVSLPVLKYGPLAAAIQSVMITQFCQALQAEAVSSATRPCFVLADEYQLFAHKSHSELLATIRSSKISFLMATQDVSTLHYQLGNRELADSIINKAGLKIILSNLSVPTNQWAADLVGKALQYTESVSTNFGENSGSGLNQANASGSSSGGEGRTQSRGRSYSTKTDYILPPSFFASDLKTGGPKNKRNVTGVIVRNGHVFPETGNHHIIASFQQ